jgi:hypothetical protein
MKTRGLGRTQRVIAVCLLLAVCLVLLAGLGAFAACLEYEREEPSSVNPDTSDAQAALPVMDQYETARSFFENAPLKQYSSFEDAEREAGYHIPRASPEYPVGFNQTTLQWFPQFDRPISTTLYTYPPLAPTSIYVVVGPSYYSRHGDEARMTGEQATVGGKKGWIYPSDTSFEFNYLCGQIDGYNLWCGAAVVKDIGWEAFEHFVSTLQ